LFNQSDVVGGNGHHEHDGFLPLRTASPMTSSVHEQQVLLITLRGIL
jgi:hypothetical protein